MASSKSQTTRNVIIALLALWSIISLIIIVVWATSPAMKSANQCREELQALTEKLEGAKVVWAKDKKALEEHLEKSWENQTLLGRRIEELMENLQVTNTSLSDYQQQNVILIGNVSALENETDMLRDYVANLTSEIQQRDDHIKYLNLNLTQMSHLMESCEALRVAAESQQKAAESQKKACDAASQHLRGELSQCKVKDNGNTAQNHFKSSGSMGQHSSAVATLLFVSLSFILSCELNSFKVHT